MIDQATQHRTCFIFSKALRQKPDGRFVGVRVKSLLEAFGPEVSKKEFGIDVQKIQDDVETAAKKRLLELENEIEELTEMVEAGFRDARTQLNLAQKEQRAILTGRLVPKPIVEVEVGKLRSLVMERREARAAAKAAEKGAGPTVVAKKAES